MAKKEMQEEVQDGNHAELRVYELGFHIDPELGAEEVKKVYQGIRLVVEKAGTVVAEGEPQKISLAYTVSRGEVGGRRDFDASFFAWIAYEVNGEGHEAVASAARAETRIFRFLDIRTDKESARHAAELHELMAKSATKEEGEEEVSDTELDQALKEVGV
jgi:ribosomal protein S6